MKLTFGEYAFDSDTREVSRDGGPVPLSPKAFALLEILIASRPKAVAKARIHEELWPATFVTESNLANLVMELRIALADQARNPRIIRTVARFGYAFCADARTAEEQADATPSGGLAYRLIWGRREIALDPGENLIGRDRDAVVWIDDGLVSRRHARIVIDERGAVLEDLGSKNGSYLRGERISAAAPLADRDALKIGPASLVFRVLHRTGSTLSSIQDRASR